MINDRLDIALAVDAHIHVGQSDLPASLARKLLGPDKLIGVSCNTEAEVQQVLSEGVADYVGLGPAYGTQTKKDLSPLLGVRGVARLLGVLGESKVKSVVIGGVGPRTVPNVLKQCVWPLPGGAYRALNGLAVVSAIAASETPRAAAEELAKLWSDRPTYPLPLHAKAGSVESIVEVSVEVLEELRKGGSPLIHHITNYVV